MVCGERLRPNICVNHTVVVIRCPQEISDIERECSDELKVVAAEAFAALSSNSTTELAEDVMCYAKCYLKHHELLDEDGAVVLDGSFALMFPNRTDDAELKSKVSRGHVFDTDHNYNGYHFSSRSLLVIAIICTTRRTANCLVTSIDA